MGEEELLERGLPADKVAHAGPGQSSEQRLDRTRHPAADPAAVDLDGTHPGKPRQWRHRPVHLGFDVQRREVAHLGERPHFHEPSRAQDRDSVAQRLHLAQDVRGQEDGLAVLAGLRHALAECAFLQRIQAARRLVQEQQIGPRHEPGDQNELLPVPLRVGTHLLGRIELEALDQQVPVGDVDVPMDATQQVERLSSGERGPEVDLARHVRDAPVGLDRICLAVDTEDLRPARRGSDEPEQQADRGGLTGAVRAQVPDHLSLRDVEAQGDQGSCVAERLRQGLCPDRRGSAHESSAPRLSERGVLPSECRFFWEATGGTRMPGAWGHPDRPA